MEAKNQATNIGATSQDAPLSHATRWETPTFVEIRMDAEIGSYQDDFDSEDWH